MTRLSEATRPGVPYKRYCELVVDGTRLVLCHYPFRTWRNMGRGWIDLHGPSHGRLKRQARQCDLGVDVWDFTPISTVEILERIRPKRGRRLSPRGY